MLKERDWDILLQAINDDQCVLVLGPDSARIHNADDSPTLSEALAAELASHNGDQAASHSELIQAAQARLYEDDLEHLYYDVRNFLKRFDDHTTDMHRHLARLPFSLCIQTSPDRFMHNAYLAEGKQPIEAYYDFSEGGGRVKIMGGDSSAMMKCGPDQPLIFGLHGHPSDAQSLVLSRNDTLDFLVNLPEYTRNLPSFLLRHTGSSDTKFLFFGFGFNYWYSQMLIHVLRKDAIRHRRVRSIAVESSKFFSRDPQTQTATFYHKTHSIDFPHVSFGEFAKQLEERYVLAFGDQPHGESSVSVTSSEDMPWAFLCYNRLDRNAVAHLAKALKERGLRLWWDQESIKGGDNWGKRVEHAISKQVDYFVVLHSKNFTLREAYSGKEISLALDRKPKMDLPDWNFIIPCNFLGSQERLEELEHLNYVELPTPSDCDELVECIMEDWESNDRLAFRQSRQGVA